MKIYSKPYSETVIKNFVLSHGRGYAYCKQMCNSLNIETAIGFFRYNQTAWNIYKLLVKTMDRLCESDYYKDDKELLRVNYLKSVKYFKGEELERYGKGLKE